MLVAHMKLRAYFFCSIFVKDIDLVRNRKNLIDGIYNMLYTVNRD